MKWRLIVVELNIIRTKQTNWIIIRLVDNNFILFNRNADE